MASKETLKEQVVLINGATGFAVQIAVQISKHLGAKTIIATGRNKETLNKLLSLGADKVFNLIEEKDLLAKSIKNNRPHLIIDYLWGEPTELILESLIPESFDFSTVTKLFQVGQSAGKKYLSMLLLYVLLGLR
ncbi:zinc-binding dehydrogenase [Staphylococcus cohnii]|uniref:zinc-binding dehydrogenase n=1 Tax=Staphylococcus cohnii TaxID=29382 RepID=UPI00374EB9A9